MRLTLALGISEKNFLQFREPLWKIGKNFCGDFALVASRAEDARHQDPSWSVWAQGKF